MLTGEVSPTSGGFELRRGTFTGYCPQENSLDGMVTVSEILKAYCLIRGVEPGDATTEVELEYIGRLTILSPHAHMYMILHRPLRGPSLTSDSRVTPRTGARS